MQNYHFYIIYINYISRFVKNVDFLLYQNTNWEITYGPNMRLKSTENVPSVITEVNRSRKFIFTLTSSILKVGRKISSVKNVKWVLFTNKLAPIIWNSNVNIQVRNHYLLCNLESGINVEDHPYKTSANFHNFWPLPPYHRHSSKMLMKGISDPYILWPFDHWHMGKPLPPKTCWCLIWMVAKGMWIFTIISNLEYEFHNNL